MTASALSLRMPPEVAANAQLATQVSTGAPSWAIAHDAAHPQANGHLEVMGSRNYHDIFRLPNLGGVVRKWLFTRPSMEAISEDSFSNSAVESMTLFRIERVDDQRKSLMITPTVSSHYLFIPCQTINGYTVGLAYLDILYERDSYGIRDNRVPPLRLGRFVIDDATGEIFCSAWMDNIMVVAWTQSILKCERVREFLLFEAPPDGTTPRSLLLRNSFFERRACYLCGLGSSIRNLPAPCSGVKNRRLSQDPTHPPMLTNVASIYRRFRGSYFGVVVKTRYGLDRQPQSQQLVPIFVELKHGLHTVKVGFKMNLRKNIDIVLGAASNDGYFGMNPRSSARSLLLLRASNPVVSDAGTEDIRETDITNTCAPAFTTTTIGPCSNDHHHHNDGIYGSPTTTTMDSRSRRSTSPASVAREDSIASGGDMTTIEDATNNVHDEYAPKRRRSEDSLHRNSVVHKRKVRNRISAQQSNKRRKMMLEQKKSELEQLKIVKPQLEQRLRELQKENEELRIKCFGPDAVGYVNDGNTRQDNINGTLKIEQGAEEKSNLINADAQVYIPLHDVENGIADVDLDVEAPCYVTTGVDGGGQDDDAHVPVDVDVQLDSWIDESQKLENAISVAVPSSVFE